MATNAFFVSVIKFPIPGIYALTLCITLKLEKTVSISKI